MIYASSVNSADVLPTTVRSLSHTTRSTGSTAVQSNGRPRAPVYLFSRSNQAQVTPSGNPRRILRAQGANPVGGAIPRNASIVSATSSSSSTSSDESLSALAQLSRDANSTLGQFQAHGFPQRVRNAQQNAGRPRQSTSGASDIMRRLNVHDRQVEATSGTSDPMYFMSDHDVEDDDETTHSSDSDDEDMDDRDFMEMLASSARGQSAAVARRSQQISNFNQVSARNGARDLLRWYRESQNIPEPTTAVTPPPQIRSSSESSADIGVNQFTNTPMYSNFRYKTVCSLKCRQCSQSLCDRGMKAILLADTKVELYSTDAPPLSFVQLVFEDYMTDNCRCRIQDMACLGCGGVVGYHVTQPCESCLDSCNNGHFWMFQVEGVECKERQDASGSKPLLWAFLAPAELDRASMHSRMELLAR